MLAVACSAWACWWDRSKSVDNLIYRLTEDVSPYYHFEDAHSISYAYSRDTETPNLALWRKQTGTEIPDSMLRWYVYTSTRQELAARRKQATRIFGEDGVRLLLIAKHCEEVRNYFNDPWYYPSREDTTLQGLERRMHEATAYRGGRYASRYALQAIRIMVTLKQYDQAVKYWEQVKDSLPKDITQQMAERHAARAYLLTGDTLTAADIYSRQGDIASLRMCRLSEKQTWELTYKNCPDSPFFLHELQYLLTHLDNRYCESDHWDTQWQEQEDARIKAALDMADRVLRERKVKDPAMWYYAKAALLNIKGQRQVALSTARRGEKVCKPGSFLATSMRVLRIMIEAETCPYDSAYEARLYRDLEWMDLNGRKNLTRSVRERFKPADGYAEYGGDAAVTFYNKYYWSDVLNRILGDVLAPRLMQEGHPTEALLYANLGEFWIMSNLYGKAESPNKDSSFFITDRANTMDDIADSCSVAALAGAYQHICKPSRGIDHLVAQYGKTSRDYWHDMIGTHCIREQRYSQAVRWLSRVSRGYQRNLSTSYYFYRDPFCPAFVEIDERRLHLKNKDHYKLNFARKMAALQSTMYTSKSANRRGEAMVLYGVGLRNQNEWCWALSRYQDTSNEYNKSMDETRRVAHDLRESKRVIDKGLATMRSPELKARYLKFMSRRKEVMDRYPHTRAAQELRAHCDLWRDYAKSEGCGD